MKLEVTFKDGTVTGFPKVEEDTLRVENGFVGFTFGERKHNACLNLDSIKWFEEMPEI